MPACSQSIAARVSFGVARPLGLSLRGHYRDSETSHPSKAVPERLCSLPGPEAESATLNMRETHRQAVVCVATVCPSSQGPVTDESIPVARWSDTPTRVVGPLPRESTVSDGLPLSHPLRRTVGKMWLLATASDAPVLPLRCLPDALCVQGQTGNRGAS